jgi:transposase
MEARMENTSSAGGNNEPVHCFVAIELSKSSWVVGFQTPLAKQTSRYQAKACDAKALLELIERVRIRVARELGRPVEVMSCYEAGYDGFWLHRVLDADRMVRASGFRELSATTPIRSGAQPYDAGFGNAGNDLAE